MTSSRRRSFDLEEIARKISEHVEIKDRAYHFKIYKECFVGKDLVTYFVNSGLVKTVSEAVDLGNLLIKEDYIKHVLYDHGFKNEKLFYEFTEGAKSRLYSQGSPHTMTSSERLSINDEELEEIAYAIFRSPKGTTGSIKKEGVKRMKKYFFGFLCFVGEELVTWLVKKGYALGVNRAVAIGNALIDKKLIHHVTHEHKFKNEYLFYQLIDDLSEEMSLSDAQCNLFFFSFIFLSML
ncbi:hypothetical protein RFI_22914 [Reticulomyxa filosa]|uniref:DEP domain-containing protein n=1 Tax=Reticulomyxa filosa TaxID=46433 RepID=X6MLF0_RETFI|nr:hypothetical protein RFI_22914 [Reticulomyxa filosa]|eukprot:ETO14456.1 hypothetical protein RFI_22914 [Reticulomyxa filosa]